MILFIFDNISNTHIYSINYENIIQEIIYLKDIIYNKDLHNNIIIFDIIIEHNCFMENIKNIVKNVIFLYKN